MNKKTSKIKLHNPRQRVYCQTCGLMFLDMDAWKYMEISLCYKNKLKGRPIYQWSEMQTLSQDKNLIDDLAKDKFDKFFINAVLHWCDNPTHTIYVTVPDINTGKLQRWELTADLKTALSIYGPKFIDTERLIMQNGYTEDAVI